MEGKTLLQSKTFWFNIITIVVDIAVALQTSVALADKATTIMILSIIQTAGNVLLRYLTDQPITKLM